MLICTSPVKARTSRAGQKHARRVRTFEQPAGRRGIQARAHVKSAPTIRRRPTADGSSHLGADPFNGRVPLHWPQWLLSRRAAIGSGNGGAAATVKKLVIHPAYRTTFGAADGARGESILARRAKVRTGQAKCPPGSRLAAEDGRQADSSSGEGPLNQRGSSSETEAGDGFAASFVPAHLSTRWKPESSQSPERGETTTRADTFRCRCNIPAGAAASQRAT